MKLGTYLRRARRGWRFMVSDVWDIELTSLSTLGQIGVKTLRVFHLVFKGFKDDECPLHASALTFSTLMAIVPVLAFSLAMARGFGAADNAKARIREAVRQWTGTFSSTIVVTNEVPAGTLTNNLAATTNGVATAAGAATNAVNPATTGYRAQIESRLAQRINEGVDAAFDKVENISFTALGGIGLVLLLWLVIQVLGRIEGSFNTVWGVTQGRTMWRKFADYLSVMVILPVLIVAASSIPIVDFATRSLDDTTAGFVRAILDSGALRILTALLMTTFTFAFIIRFMPNTKVHSRPALVGGLIAALLFIAWLKVCSAFQVGVARADKIYGGFAIVPIVLAWVYVSWEIVLFGAELAFAVQNCATYRMEQGARQASMEAKILLALSVVARAGRAMLGRNENLHLPSFARNEQVPVRFLNEIIDILVGAGLMAALADRENCYVLLKAPDKLKAGTVVEAVMNSGVQPGALGLGRVEEQIGKTLELAAAGMGKSLDQTSILDLVEPAVLSKADRET